MDTRKVDGRRGEEETRRGGETPRSACSLPALPGLSIRRVKSVFGFAVVCGLVWELLFQEHALLTAGSFIDVPVSSAAYSFTRSLCPPFPSSLSLEGIG